MILFTNDITQVECMGMKKDPILFTSPDHYNLIDFNSKGQIRTLPFHTSIEKNIEPSISTYYKGSLNQL